MAFHVACPITCRKICFCAFGFPAGLRSEKGKNDFLQEVARVEQFLSDPWLIKARENATIQVKVPKVVVSSAPVPPAPQFPAAESVGAGVGGDEAAKMAASSRVKRAVLQKQAVAASMVAEDYARKFESGDLVDVGEEQGNPNSKVMCRLCFSGENEGSDRARKMLSCSSCGKKYHRSCLKAWSQNRDLFHWSSWACPSCRTCEVCRRTGDPSKFMFCKRCDGAYHCYCQQPPHKNVGHGPYLCPKHTKCHSCSSTVPGNGLSVRWFLGYTCCDACGRLFVKGNYCPVCLKVYRDSESTPMVCCDICQRWVHCPCDGISDAKYMQFQVDGNLQYVCPMCRGECCQVRTIEDAVPELWRRRDEADKDLIATLRAAAGLPTQDEIFDISPFSDDEESGTLLKNEQGRSFKFPVKGFGDKSPKKSKDHGKKSSKKGKKKGNDTTSISAGDVYHGAGGQVDGPLGHDTVSNKREETQSPGADDTYSPVTGSVMEGLTVANEASVSKLKSEDEMKPTNITKASRAIKIKSSSRSRGFVDSEDTGTNSDAPKPAHGPKLVIHLGGRGRNTITPPRSEVLSYKRAQDMTSPNDQVKGSKPRENEGHSMKLKNAKSQHSNPSTKQFGEFADGYESVSSKNKYSLLGKRGNEEITYARRGSQDPTGRKKSGTGDLIDDNSSMPSISQASSKDHRPYLKFKIHRNSNTGNQNVSSNLNTGNQKPSPLPVKEEITYTRGQRSKRKRPAGLGDDDLSQLREENSMKDLSDANWILQKLGKDAAGKRVEIHQAAIDSWCRGTVTEISEDATMVSIALDDGKTKNFELGKHGIRFVSQKPKH